MWETTLTPEEIAKDAILNSSSLQHLLEERNSVCASKEDIAYLEWLVMTEACKWIDDEWLANRHLERQSKEIVGSLMSNGRYINLSKA